MCGRYVSVQSDADLTDEFDIERVVDEPLAPSWNVAPTDPVRVVVERPPHPADNDGDDGGHNGNSAGAAAPGTPQRQLRTVRWGLVPSWSKDARGGARMINARIETVTEKPAFRRAAAKRRCLVPALGYYEWQRRGAAKVPYFLHDAHGAPLAFAGLYELWRDDARPDDDPQRWLWTCTIITQQAADQLGEIHDRNPVVVPPDLRAAWLDCSSEDAATAADLLARIPEAHLAPYVVSAAVGNVKNNGPELIEPVADPDRAAAEQQTLDI